jgi:hypothetical protein
MGCFDSGEPIEVVPGVPEDVKKLREGLIQILQQGMKQGATPYTGPIAPMTNPLLLSSANMLMGLMGQGAYKQPGYYSMAGSPGSGGVTYPFGITGEGHGAKITESGGHFVPYVPGGPLEPGGKSSKGGTIGFGGKGKSKKGGTIDQ